MLCQLIKHIFIKEIIIYTKEKSPYDKRHKGTGNLIDYFLISSLNLNSTQRDASILTVPSSL